MIHIFLGTKAQYIKTAPVIWQLEAKGLAYRLIDSGQHAALSGWMRQELQIRDPDVFLRSGQDLATVSSGLSWLIRWLGTALVNPRLIRKKLFADQPGICLVHGDTASTFLGAWAARRAGLKVAHLEAGLRSHHPLSPFPEELCRWVTTGMADLLLAPSPQAIENLKKARVRGRVVDLGANTGMAAVEFSLKKAPAVSPPWPRYGLALIHRMETLYAKQKLEKVVQTLLQACQKEPILFLLHEPTRRALAEAGLMGKLTQEKRIQTRSLVPHPEFLSFLRQAQFVITDGGSVQEESFYLDIPCLILRDRTERPEGLIPPGNVCLSRWDAGQAKEFLSNPQAWRRHQPLPQAKPSWVAVEALKEWS